MNKAVYKEYYKLLRRHYPLLNSHDLEDLTHGVLYELTLGFIPLEPIHVRCALKAARKVHLLTRKIHIDFAGTGCTTTLCKKLTEVVKIYLPEEVRKQVEFYCGYNFSATRIAKELGISRQAASYRLKKLVRTIQQHVPIEVLNEIQDQCRNL